jgi:hypothetical protein
MSTLWPEAQSSYENAKHIRLRRHALFMSFFGGPTDGPSFDRKKYEHLTLSIRQTVLERARGRCQKCQVKFSASVPPQFQHINRSLKDNRPLNLRALCPECFKSVEKDEREKRGMLGGLGKVLKKIPVDLKK